MKPYDQTTDKKSQIRTMFDNIAPTYDRLNHLLSMNIDRLWRHRTARTAARFNPSRILDVATGTGDMAVALARRIPQAAITGTDISEEMMRVARTKVAQLGLDGRIEFATGDAEHLAAADGSFDVVTVAFGVRNFEDIDAGLREMRRVLKEGGHLLVLELSTPRNRLFRRLYNLYSHRVLPRVGRMISHDGKAYEYLPASVDEFPAPAEFARRVREAGFARCENRSLGFGIAQLYIAKR